MPIDDALDEIITAIETDGFDGAAQAISSALDALVSQQDGETRLPAWAETLAQQLRSAIEITAALHQDGQTLTLDIGQGTAIRWQWTPGEAASIDFAMQVLGSVVQTLGAPVLVLPISPKGRRYQVDNQFGEVFEDEDFDGQTLTIELRDNAETDRVLDAIGAIGEQEAPDAPAL
jgi:hypothetical protein